MSAFRSKEKVWLYMPRLSKWVHVYFMRMEDDMARVLYNGTLLTVQIDHLRKLEARPRRRHYREVARELRECGFTPDEIFMRLTGEAGLFKQAYMGLKPTGPELEKLRYLKKIANDETTGVQREGDQ